MIVSICLWAWKCHLNQEMLVFQRFCTDVSSVKNILAPYIHTVGSLISFKYLRLCHQLSEAFLGCLKFQSSNVPMGLPRWLSGERIHLPMQGTWVWSLGWEDPLEEQMATHSSIPAWRIPWVKEPGSSPRGTKESNTTLWLNSSKDCTRLWWGFY